MFQSCFPRTFLWIAWFVGITGCRSLPEPTAETTELLRRVSYDTSLPTHEMSKTPQHVQACSKTQLVSHELPSDSTQGSLNAPLVDTGHPAGLAKAKGFLKERATEFRETAWSTTKFVAKAMAYGAFKLATSFLDDDDDREYGNFRARRRADTNLQNWIDARDRWQGES